MIGGLNLQRLAVACLAILMVVLPQQAYAADWPEAAEELISEIGEQAMQSIALSKSDPDRARSEFAEIFRNSFDVPTIARFTAGRYWREMSSDQQSEYTGLLEEAVLDLYADRLRDYAGASLNITGHRTTGRSDAIVSMRVQPAGSSQNFTLEWRVRQKADSELKIVDVSVEGVSMSLTHRSEFASIIQRGGGDVESLLIALREKEI